MFVKGYVIHNRYELIEPLGRGSFAEVWAAQDKTTQREIAVKICKASLIAEEEEEREKAIRRFEDEIASMILAKSPYVVQILNHGKEREVVPPHAWYYYIIMERMKGTVADLLDSSRNKPEPMWGMEEFLYYARYCLLGLIDLHKKSIIHRDIKPSNLFFSFENSLKLGDLGIARLTEHTRQTQTMFGTVGYAAPELFVHKEEASVQSDLFSMGIVFYEMLAQRHPVSEKGPFHFGRETIRRLMNADFYSLDKVRPGLPSPLLKLIQSMTALAKEKRPVSAEKVLQEMKKIQSQVAADHTKQAQQFLSQGQKDLAIAEFQKITQMKLNDASPYNQLGLIYYKERLYEKAKENFSLALERKESTITYNNRGLCHYYLKKYDEAIEDFSKAIQLDPKFAEAYNNRGLAYHKKKEYDRALNNFNRTLSIQKKDASAYNNRGMVYREQGEYDKAISDFSRSVALQPKDPEVYFNRAMAYRQKQRYDEAWEDLTEALKYDSQDPNIYYHRGLIWQKRQDYKSALSDFEHALSLRPDHPKITECIAHCRQKLGWE